MLFGNTTTSMKNKRSDRRRTTIAISFNRTTNANDECIYSHVSINSRYNNVGSHRVRKWQVVEKVSTDVTCGVTSNFDIDNDGSSRVNDETQSFGKVPYNNDSANNVLIDIPLMSRM